MEVISKDIETTRHPMMQAEAVGAVVTSQSEFDHAHVR